jgi:hypothetical protein
MFILLAGTLDMVGTVEVGMVEGMAEGRGTLEAEAGTGSPAAGAPVLQQLAVGGRSQFAGAAAVAHTRSDTGKVSNSKRSALSSMDSPNNHHSPHSRMTSRCPFLYWLTKLKFKTPI